MRKRTSVRKRKPKDGDAFIRESEQVTGTRDDLAEMLAEQYLVTAVSGEESHEEAFNEVVPEELGGPFLETEADSEFGRTVTEASEMFQHDVEERRRGGILTVEAEPTPQAVGSLAIAPVEETLPGLAMGDGLDAERLSALPDLTDELDEFEPFEPDDEPPAEIPAQALLTSGVPAEQQRR